MNREQYKKLPEINKNILINRQINNKQQQDSGEGAYQCEEKFRQS